MVRRFERRKPKYFYMNRNLLILVTGILIGVATVYLLFKGPQNIHQSAEVESADLVSEDASITPPLEEPRNLVPPLAHEALVSQPVALAAAPPPVSAWARLAEKYTPEKTVLSSKVTSNLTSLINQGVDLANTAARNSGSGSIAEAASKEILRNTASRLALTGEQQEQAAAVIQSAVNKRIAAVSDLTSAMSFEPEHVMEMLLAGDALARNQITQQEYDRIAEPTRAMLQNIAGYVTGQAGGNPSQFLMDEETLAQINAILTPEQQAVLAEMTASMAQRIQARQANRNLAGTTFQPGQIPIMELERLDQAVASMKQMADAARLMMDGMKGLKEANPTGGGS